MGSGNTAIINGSVVSREFASSVAASGPAKTKLFPLGQFSKIASEIPVDMLWTQGAPHAELTGTVLDQINMEVIGDTLHLTTQGGYNTHPAVARVQSGQLNAVQQTGFGCIRAEGVDAPDFGVTLTGSGTVTVSGKAQRLEVQVTGSGQVEGYGDFDTTSLHINGSGGVVCEKTRKAEVLLNGSGMIKVLADDHVQGSVNGSGTLLVDGPSPTLNVITAGSGSVSRYKSARRFVDAPPPASPPPKDIEF